MQEKEAELQTTKDAHNTEKETLTVLAHYL